jgi:hypothetical protein
MSDLKKVYDNIKGGLKLRCPAAEGASIFKTAGS